jgi:hypothetical protein
MSLTTAKLILRYAASSAMKPNLEYGAERVCELGQRPYVLTYLSPKGDDMPSAADAEVSEPYSDPR